MSTCASLSLSLSHPSLSSLSSLSLFLTVRAWNKAAIQRTGSGGWRTMRRASRTAPQKTAMPTTRRTRTTTRTTTTTWSC
jgi:hypothetical protein